MAPPRSLNSAEARSTETNIEAVADELYALPLDEFTEVRNERAKQAREAGYRAAADAIRKLSKPNTVAWLANQLVRRHRDEIDPMLELGASLREATASLDADQLRALSKQQHQVIYALVQQARRLAADVGQSVSESVARGLEETLHAALAEPDAAAALRTGRLTAGLSSSGFLGAEVVARVSAGKAPASTKPAPAATSDSDEARRRQLQRAREDEEAARTAAQEADAANRAAHERLDAAEAVAHRAGADVDRLRRELHDATNARADADRAERQARKDADRAQRQARQADRRLADAQARRAELEK